MNDDLPDRTVLLIILATLLLVFTLIFSLRPAQKNLQPAIQWKDTTQNTTSEVLQI